ncbi:MFS transporter [Dermacoccaceae bacterium W4C1]
MSSRRPMLGLITAEAFSITGSRLSTIAVPWLVLTTTGSAVATGAVAMAEMLPYVLMKAAGGPMIDRIGAKRVALACQFGSIPVLAAVPVLHLLGWLHLAVLIPLMVLLGALRGPSDGATHALVPEVATAADVPLERVTGLSGAVERLGTTIGAAIAGAVVALFGPAAALGVNAACFAVALVLIALTVPSRATSAAADAGERYLTQLRQGWTFLRTDAVLVGITTMVSLANLLDQAWSVVLVPVWAKETGAGAGAVGMVFAVFAAASIAGALLASGFADRLPRLPVYVLGFLIGGVPRFIAFATEASTPVLVVLLAIGGFASGFVNPVLGAVIFERIPESMRGRVSSLNTALCWSLIPFGGLLGGGLIALVGLHSAIVVIGVLYLLVTLMPLAHPGFREFGRRSSAPSRSDLEAAA